MRELALFSAYDKEGVVSLARALVAQGMEIVATGKTRGELEARGICFRSHSDTEVILEGYRLWGDAVIDRLRGMFAFALWDSTLQRLLLARDRLGKKPLYWAKLGDALVFGSELKALMAWPGFESSLDPPGNGVP